MVGGGGGNGVARGCIVADAGQLCWLVEMYEVYDGTGAGGMIGGGE